MRTPFGRKIINLKYKKENGSWFTKIPTVSHSVGLWKSISIETDHLRKNCSLVPGNGRRIKFREDEWCGEGPLCDSFSNLYRIAATKGTIIADNWDDSRGEGA